MVRDQSSKPWASGAARGRGHQWRLGRGGQGGPTCTFQAGAEAVTLRPWGRRGQRRESVETLTLQPLAGRLCRRCPRVKAASDSEQQSSSLHTDNSAVIREMGSSQPLDLHPRIKATKQEDICPCVEERGAGRFPAQRHGWQVALPRRLATALSPLTASPGGIRGPASSWLLPQHRHSHLLPGKLQVSPRRTWAMHY